MLAMADTDLEQFLPTFAQTGCHVAFLVPTLVCIIYAYRIFKSDEKIVKNVAEIPSVFSLSSVIGWNLYYFIEIPFVKSGKICDPVTFPFRRAMI